MKAAYSSIPDTEALLKGLFEAGLIDLTEFEERLWAVLSLEAARPYDSLLLSDRRPAAGRSEPHRGILVRGALAIIGLFAVMASVVAAGVGHFSIWLSVAGLVFLGLSALHDPQPEPEGCAVTILGGNPPR